MRDFGEQAQSRGTYEMFEESRESITGSFIMIKCHIANEKLISSQTRHISFHNHHIRLTYHHVKPKRGRY